MTPSQLARLASLEAMDLGGYKWPEVRERLAAELAELQALRADRPAVTPAALLERARGRAATLGLTVS